MADKLEKVMTNKMSPFVVDLLKQYLPKVQSDQTRIGLQKANTTPAELEQLETQAKKAGAIGKMQKQMLLNARKTAADKTIPFTFPNGETKAWDKMSEDERDFVQGQSLRTKGRLNEDPYKESAFDAYINPFNFLGNLAANAAESNYTAKQTGSNMPYLSAYGLPLALGALGGLAKGKAVETPIVKAPIVEAETIVEAPVEKKLSQSTIDKINKQKLFQDKINEYYSPEIHDISKDQYGKVVKHRMLRYNKDVDPHIYEKEFQQEFAEQIKRDPEYRVGDLQYEKDLNLYSHLKANKEIPATDKNVSAFYKVNPELKERTNAVAKKLNQKGSNFTEKEKSLIRAFSRGYDKKLNYRDYSEDFRPSNTELYDKLRDEFENVITKTKTQEPFEVKRGDMDFNVKHVWRNGEKLPEGSVRYSELQPGDEWMPDKFTSTSFAPETDKNFGNIQSFIDVPKGQSVGMPNMFKNPEFANEEELILPRKLKYKVEQNNIGEKLVRDLNKAPKELINLVKNSNDANRIMWEGLSDKGKLNVINDYILQNSKQHMKHSITNPYMTVPGLYMLNQLKQKLNKKQNT
jgi:hypothetical protein